MSTLKERLQNATLHPTDTQRYIITIGEPPQAVLDENFLITIRVDENANDYRIYATAHDNTNGFDGLLGGVSMPYGLTDVLTIAELNAILWGTQHTDWELGVKHIRETQAGNIRVTKTGNTRITH